MKKKKKKKEKIGSIDYVVFFTVIILLVIGIIMVYSSSSYYSLYHNGSSTTFLKKELFAAVAGIVAMLFFMCFDYHKLKKITVPILIITIPLLLAVRLFEPVNGAYRWIRLGPLSFQPSELAKYGLVLFMAMSLTAMGDKVKSFWKGIMPYIIISGVYAGIILAWQSNLSNAAIIMMVTVLMLFVAGGRMKHFFCYLLPSLLGLVGLAIYFEPYRMKRFLNFIDPWKDAAGDGYQLIQSLYAFGSGGLTGLGLGQSRQKALYMPEPHTDFIFSIIGEEVGLIGCLIIILVFAVLIWKGINIALEAKDTYGSLLAMGIISVIAVQLIVNIAVVTGSMPVTGVPMPFISYGGTSLSITMGAMGILLNISRQREKEKIYL